MFEEFLWISIGYIAVLFPLSYVAYGSLVCVITAHEPDREQIISFANNLKFPFSVFSGMLTRGANDKFAEREHFNWWSGLFTKLFMSIIPLFLLASFCTRVLEEASNGNMPSMLLYLLAAVIYGFSYLCAWFFGRSLGKARQPGT